VKQSRFSEEQVILALREHESKGKTVAVICRELGISQATFFKWKKQFGGMSVNEARRLRELERENSKLKRMLADRMLELDLLQEALKKL
jgi:putative transposase